ncbi:phenylacetic acid degradation protein [Sphingomonas sp. Leaf33]|uniref:PaaI family thioesterase n=1 Tax=Sphingomonas sp. Leaf33 TaxID=1736215 RepID=UPI0006FEE178|nr:PaaI family thioesterase [Sphingomonas sp. Leaf33]KQN24973.1 phenylacetic acid degradation protein [Sphingomonas sp. Leaf33]
MTLPPYATLLGMSIQDDDDGTRRLAMAFSGKVSGRPGYLHGGAIGGMLEMAAILRLRDALGTETAVVKPVTLTVDYMRGGREKITYAAGIVRRLGSRVANVDAIAWQDDRTHPIAAARLTFLIRR